jgi:hypothetical protein
MNFANGIRFGVPAVNELALVLQTVWPSENVPILSRSGGKRTWSGHPISVEIAE